MIEIRYSRSQAGLDNIFDLFHINDYIPVPISEQHSEGTELRFYLSLFKRFDILSPPTTGTKYIWNIFHPLVLHMIFQLRSSRLPASPHTLASRH